ncbi:MAG: HTH domain-containing protein [Thermoguttaceae bacterium]|nr:HTH domain-containing protein [Thermoguttaceae bacterium]
MKQCRLERLIILLRLLQAGRSYHTQSLAVECGVSQRTIFRDLNVLREAGIPLIFDGERQGYAVYGARLLPATHFTTDEVLAMLFLGRELVAQLPVPCFSAAHRAILKLEGALPLRLVEQVRAAGEPLHVSSLKTNPLEQAEPIYEAILKAQMDRHAIWMDY